MEITICTRTLYAALQHFQADAFNELSQRPNFNYVPLTIFQVSERREKLFNLAVEGALAVSTEPDKEYFRTWCEKYYITNKYKKLQTENNSDAVVGDYLRAYDVACDFKHDIVLSCLQLLIDNGERIHVAQAAANIIAKAIQRGWEFGE